MKAKRMSYDFIEKFKRDIAKNPEVQKEMKKIRRAVARMKAAKSNKK